VGAARRHHRAGSAPAPPPPAGPGEVLGTDLAGGDPAPKCRFTLPGPETDLADHIQPVARITYAGYVLAGCGLAFAFPVVIDLAGAVSRRSDGTGGEREIGFVTTIAYLGFLIGPPMVGGLAHQTSLSFAIGFIGFIAMLIAPTALASAAARRREERIARGIRTVT
jgi:hypothetical protein